MSYIEILIVVVVMGIIIIPIMVSTTGNNLSTAESIGMERAVYIAEGTIAHKTTGEAFNTNVVYNADATYTVDTTYTVKLENEITINLATDTNAVITSTTNQMIDVVNADENVKTLITLAKSGGDDGSGLATEIPLTNLSGGGVGVNASTTIAPAGANNDFTVTANAEGTTGNTVRIELIKPTVPSSRTYVTSRLKAKVTWKVAGKDNEYILYGTKPVIDYNN